MHENMHEYDIFMKTDFNSTGYAQWFYFKISNTKHDQVLLKVIYRNINLM